MKLLAGSSALGCVDKTRLHVFIADALMSVCDVTCQAALHFQCHLC